MTATHTRKIMFGGFLYPFRGLMFLLSNPGLIKFIAIPAVINTLLYALFVFYFSSRLAGWVEFIVPAGNGWYWALIYYLLIIAAGFIFLLIAIYTFVLLGNLILAPFNEIISERVEAIKRGRSADIPFTIKGFVRDMARSYRAEGGRLLMYLAGFLILFAVNLIPMAGQVLYGILVTLYTLFFLCWEFLDYSMERRRFTFSEKRKVAMGNILTFISFGAGASMMLVIPIANLMAIPVCVAGATILFCDLMDMRKRPA